MMIMRVGFSLSPRSCFFFHVVVVILYCLLFLQSFASYVTASVTGVEPPERNGLAQFFFNLTHSDRYLQVMTVCITNSVMIPSIWISYQRQLYPECVCGFMLLLSSSCYHIGETLQCKIWGMNHGQWHRLDNVFVIASLQSLFFFIFTATSVTHARLRPNQTSITLEDEKFVEREKSSQNLARWISFVFVILCQEKAPWREIYTFVPIAAVLAYTSIRMFFFTPVHYRPRFNFKMLGIGLSLFMVGAIFFIRGLDDEHDYLKINHGLWHSFGGIGFVFLFRSKRESKRLKKQLLHREQYLMEYDKLHNNKLQQQQQQQQQPLVLNHINSNNNTNNTNNNTFMNTVSMFRRKDKRSSSSSSSSPASTIGSDDTV